MHRLGHASQQAALRYQHATTDRDRAIADALESIIDSADGVQFNVPGEPRRQ